MPVLDPQAVDPRDVARGPDSGMRGTTGGIGQHAVAHRDPRFGRQLVPRRHPDAGDDEGGGEEVVTGPHAGVRDRGHGEAGAHDDAGGMEQVAHACGERRPERPAPQRRCKLDQRRPQAARGERRRDLQADEAATNDDDLASGGGREGFLEPPRIGRGPQHERRLPAGDRQPARHRAGREHAVFERDLAPSSRVARRVSGWSVTTLVPMRSSTR